ncbi:MAG: tetratricopeptide repeat protein, partial [Candidatus Sumerlaeaceae bacterium]|nr:tetratricopeptide repeat protein [Candidatus Sumerlaeaceae bacterium]
INYADSDYVKELAVRLPGEDTSTSSTALKNTTARLETEVASAGEGAQTVAARLELVRNYARLRQYDRALEIAKPLAADVKGKPEEAEVLDLTATCHIGKGDNAAAKSELETLLKDFPQYSGRARARLNMGLASEQEGNYQRALAEYRALATDSPGTEEARLATERIADLQKLSN